MGSLEGYLSQLSPEQRELFEFMLKERREAAAPAAPVSIQPRSDTSTTPISFGQQRLWFLDQWEPDSPAYNLPQAVQLRGLLDIPALERSLNTIVQRHETLRTRFPVSDGQPHPVVEPALALRIPLEDLRTLSTAEREHRLQQRLVEESRRPFDLASGPLLRTLLFQTAPDSYVMLLTLHHIVSDGWSNGVLVRELGALYRAFAAGQPAQLPALAIQYPDYAAWQHGWLQGETLERQIRYWRNQLAGAPAQLALPTDRPRPTRQTYTGARHSVRIGQEQTEALKRLSQREGASLFMTLLSVFEVLLLHYTGQRDLLIGTPVANRNRAEIEGLIGFFVNTLVLRADLGGRPSFRELIRRARTTTLEAQDYQDLPFERLIEALDVEIDTSRNPLFQVMFALQNAPLPRLGSPELTITPLEIDVGVALFDLSLDLYEAPDGLRGWFEYNTDLFDAATVVRMAGHYLRLVDLLLDQPDLPVEQAELLSPAERTTLLLDWSGARAQPTPALPVHRLFERQAARQPDATALICGDTRLCYAELNALANRAAGALLEAGVGRGQFVGVCMERSPELVAALLGVLKIGAAYIPLDPTHPRDRLAYVLADAGAAALLTTKALLERLPEQCPPTLTLDQTGPAALPNPDVSLGPDDPAYLISTSGSTGQAKAVVVTHGGLASIYAAWEGSYGLGPGLPVHLQMANLTFDVFSGDLVRALCSGAALLICPRDLLLDPQRLYDLIERERVSCGEFVPVVLRTLLKHMADHNLTFTQLRLLVCGSDSWSIGEYRRVRQLCPPGARVINSFGLTEATIDSTFFEADADDLRDDQTVPIGRPFANSLIYILTPQLRPAPIGVPGELYIGGLGLAQGYHGRPDLTAERFVPNPFGVGGAPSWGLGAGEENQAPRTKNQQPDGTSNSKLKTQNSKLYKTGDRARWRADGTVEFLGRVDQQLKVRGYRIEPGEVEAVLRQYPGVREAVVAQDGSADEARLVAYITSIQTTPPSAEQLRAFAQTHLPDYMVPSLYVVLEAMPLNSSGKINRRALPAPASARADASAYTAPRSSTEELLADIWARVLGQERVDVHASFFTLGGHSLLATQVMARVGSVFGVDLPLRSLFDHPTVGQLATLIDQTRVEAGGQPTPPIVAVPRDQPLPLSFPQEQLWTIDQISTGNVAYLIPAMVRIKGPLRLDVFQRCFDTALARHEIFRSTYHLHNGHPVQVVQPPGPAPVTLIDLRAHPDPEQEVLRLAGELSMQPIDLAAGPMASCTLFRLGADEHALLFLMHHIVIDEWSSDLLLQELQELYLAYSHRRAPVLPDMPVQYADFAAWQRAWFQGDVLERQLDYWRRKLDGAPSMVNLPTDRPRPPEPTFRGRYQLVPLPPRLAADLRRLSSDTGTTIFMLLMAAFHLLLARSSAQNDIVVGTPIANRTRLEVERVIGYFLNTLLIRSDTSGNPTFLQFLEQIRTACLEAYAHQDLHFEQLVRELRPRRQQSYNPLFNVMFVFNPNYPMADVEADGLTVSYMYLPREVARFDMILYYFESAHGNALQLNYNTDLFDQTTMERFLERYLALLAEVVRDPHQPIAALDLLTPAERRTIERWGQGPRTSAPAASVVELFAAQVARAPQAPALWADGRQISYAELDRCANRLAHLLRARGAGTEQVLAVYLERSPELVVTLLATLKAGAAYLPLDTAAPVARLADTLASAGARLLITSSSLRELLPAERPPTLCLDAIEAELAAQPDHAPAVRLHPEQLAYVMYTSGSTGTPKGIAIPQRAIVRLVQQPEYIRLDSQETLLMFAPASFDASTLEIWGALANGARLVICPPELPTLDDLGDLIRRERVTTLWLTAGLFHQMVDTQGPALRGVRQLLAGGDVLSPDHVRRASALLDNGRLINGYGPTENTTFTCCFPVPRDDASSSIPIGRPINDTQVYILDKQLRPVPIGIVGELYTAGDGLARGYAGRPDLTAERFLPNPFGFEGARDWGLGTGEPNQEPGSTTVDTSKLKTQNSKLYKTGDLARWRADGAVEFLGRSDGQIKLRGFRIELGEIETLLRGHPDVREAAVLAREDGGDKRLVAYVVLAQESETESTKDTKDTNESGHEDAKLKTQHSTLKTYLSGRLPDYMVPTAFVTLERLPLTPNGKLDRRALPAPDASATASSAPFVAPRTPEEIALAELVGQVLGRTPIGIHDNFFELGGHSLLAVQAIARIRTEFGLDLSLRDLFARPTVAELARQIEVLRWASQSQAAALAPASDDEIEGEL
ncbi:MAG TPA: amino acid adenylation domain-containing protein [Roseiflexaceae bacterium]|nr:amino acid adenylation domain-containing protein [Roseiflexaceae bacterium]